MILYWTPVENGLPKKKGDYLVTIEHKFSSNDDKGNTKEVVTHCVAYAQFAQSAWRFRNDYTGEYSDLDWDVVTGFLQIGISQKVIAWMPLPEPY